MFEQADATKLDSTFLKCLLLSQPVQRQIVAKLGALSTESQRLESNMENRRSVTNGHRLKICCIHFSQAVTSRNRLKVLQSLSSLISSL